MNNSDKKEILPALSCLVFRTSLNDKDDVERVSGILNSLKGITDWHVDLDDWEKVLRIESEGVPAANIIDALQIAGVSIEELQV